MKRISSLSSAEPVLLFPWFPKSSSYLYFNMWCWCETLQSQYCSCCQFSVNLPSNLVYCVSCLELGAKPQLEPRSLHESYMNQLHIPKVFGSQVEVTFQVTLPGLSCGWLSCLGAGVRVPSRGAEMNFFFVTTSWHSGQMVETGKDMSWESKWTWNGVTEAC